jgi:hypothetical protein
MINTCDYLGSEGTRILIQEQSGQKSLVRLHLKKQLGMVVHTCNPEYTGSRSRIVVWGLSGLLTRH